MRIDAVAAINVRSLLAALPRSLAPFADGLNEAAKPVPVPPPVGGPTPSVQMLVALSANHPEVERRRRIAAPARAGIEALERLHAALLAGTPAPETLRGLAAWAESIEMPSDPALAALVRDIDLRVRVELAKLDIEA